MSPVDRPDPRHRILGLALQLAAYPRQRKHEHAYEARVPWRLITELRAASAMPASTGTSMHVTLRKHE